MTNEQEQIGEHEKEKVAFGFVRNLATDERKDYTIYKFNLASTHEGKTGSLEYSGFSLAGVQNDMYIRFKYKPKGEYLNVIEIMALKFLNNDPITREDKHVKKYENLFAQYLDLYITAVRICMKENRLSDEEIKSQFIRLQKIMGLDILFEQIDKKIKDGYFK